MERRLLPLEARRGVYLGIVLNLETDNAKDPLTVWPFRSLHNNELDQSSY